MFEIIFYKDKSGRSRIVEYLDDLILRNHRNYPNGRYSKHEETWMII